jgi:hypothetical protein
MEIKKEVLDELIKDYNKPEDLIGETGLLKQLTKALMEHVAGAAAMLCYVQTMRHRQDTRKRFQPNSLTGAI